MSETIQLVAADGHTFDAWCETPSAGPLGAIVVIQEIFGVTGHIRAIAADYAASGYAVVVPALFDRVRPGIELAYSEIPTGKGLVEQISTDAAMRDIAAAVDWARQYGKVAVVGFCWGGTLAYLAARKLPITAAIAYYGGGIAGQLGTAPKVPVMYHFGAEDMFIKTGHVNAIRTAVGDYHLFVYEGAGHGFNCNERPDYRAEASELARRRSLAFLATQLG